MSKYPTSREELVKLFHLPLKKVAKKYNICITIMKVYCRKFGIPRWPYRKIRSIDKIVQTLERKNELTKQDNKYLGQLLVMKESIKKDPSIIGSRENPNEQFILKYVKRNLNIKEKSKIENEFNFISMSKEENNGGLINLVIAAEMIEMEPMIFDN